MPWCDPCSRFYNPNSLPESGACPSCGELLTDERERPDESKAKAPWHFWLFAIAAAGYLIWRAIDGVRDLIL